MSVYGSLGLLTDGIQGFNTHLLCPEDYKGCRLPSISLACVLTAMAMTLDVKGKPKVPPNYITSEHRKNQAL